MSGPAPKPTKLKELAGNPGKRKLNKSEPKPVPGIPSCPRHLSDRAKREWHRVTRELNAVGLLTQVDRAELAIYCQAYARWIEAEEYVTEHGLTVTTPNLFVVPSPYLGIANKAMEQMHKFAQQFGMTPAARSRISLEKPAEEDPFEAFVKQKLGEKA